MSNLAIARRYARAVALLARSEGVLPTVTADVAAFARTCSLQPALLQTLESPAFGLPERHKLLASVLSRMAVHRIARNFLFLLLDKGRIGAVAGIASELVAIDDAAAGRARAEVRSANKLDAATLGALELRLRTLTGSREIVVTQVVDPTLIGGMVTRIGDKVYDGSVRTQLLRLRHHLTHRDIAQA